MSPKPSPICTKRHHTVWDQYFYCSLDFDHFGPHVFSLSVDDWVEEANNRARRRGAP